MFFLDFYVLGFKVFLRFSR